MCTPACKPQFYYIKNVGFKGVKVMMQTILTGLPTLKVYTHLFKALLLF